MKFPLFEQEWGAEEELLLLVRHLHLTLLTLLSGGS